MGLDVYLYHCADRATAHAVEKQYERESEAIWARDGTDFQSKTEAERAAIRKECDALKLKLGMNGYNGPGVTKIERASAKYPEHYFKIGYFRSSYNDGGINSVFRRLGVPDLYDIIEPEEQYEFVADWAECKLRAEHALQLLTDQDGMEFDIFEARVTPALRPDLQRPTNAQEARAIFMKERQRNSTGPFGKDGYSNASGEFMPAGLQVVATIPGMCEYITRQVPCVYVVYKNEHGMKFYREALEIVIETMDYVLAQPDPQNFYLHWSS